MFPLRRRVLVFDGIYHVQDGRERKVPDAWETRLPIHDFKPQNHVFVSAFVPYIEDVCSLYCTEVLYSEGPRFIYVRRGLSYFVSV